MGAETTSDPDARRKRCRRAAETGDRSAIPELAGLLGDPNRGVQAAAFEALRVLGGEETAVAVLPLLRSTNERVRNLAREALLPLASSHPDVFLPYLQDEDRNVPLFVVEMLAQWKDPKAVEAIRPLVEDAHPNIRSQVAIALGDLGLAPGVPYLFQLCGDEEDWVCFAAIEALGKIQGGAGLPTLSRIALEGKALLAAGAVDALIETGHPSVIGIVLETLPRFASEPSIRGRILRAALGFIEDHPGASIPEAPMRAARSTISTAMKEGDMLDQMRAVRLAAGLGDREAVHSFLKLAEKGAGPVQIAAIDALGVMKVIDAESLLKRLMDHEDAEVVEHARDALSGLHKE